MANNDLAVQRVGDDLHILGMLDADDAHKNFAGLDSKHHQHTALVISAADATEHEIESAVSAATICGKLVGDKHIKFAAPVVITGITKKAVGPIAMQAKIKRDIHQKKQDSQGDDIVLADPRIEQLFAPQSEPDASKEEKEQGDQNPAQNMTRPHSKYAVHITYTPQDGVYDLLDTLQSAIKHASALVGTEGEELTKEAHKYANTPFFEAMRDAKVDGSKIGFDLPVRVEFGNPQLQETFLLLGKRAKPIEVDPDTFKQHKDVKKAASAKVEDALVKLAHSRMPASMRLARIRRLLTVGWGGR